MYVIGRVTAMAKIIDNGSNVRLVSESRLERWQEHSHILRWLFIHQSSEKIQGYVFLSLDLVCKGKTSCPVVNTLKFPQAMNELELLDIYRPVLTTCIR